MTELNNCLLILKLSLTVQVVWCVAGTVAQMTKPERLGQRSISGPLFEPQIAEKPFCTRTT